MKAYGSDTVLPQKDGSFLLECPMPKGWIGRKTGTQMSAEHPGTAVRWEDQIFEVVEAAPGQHGGIRYRLAPWEGRHAIRVVAAYDGAAEQARGREQTERRTGIWKRRATILLAPLAGLLPGPVQLRMEGDFGAPARWLTFFSAFPLFVIGVLRILEARLAMMGAGALLPSWLALPIPIAVYLALESAVRLWSLIFAGEPMGSLPGVVAYEAWRLATGRTAPASTRPVPPTWDSADTYKMLEPLLALLSPEEQEWIEGRHAFDPLRWGRRSAILVGILAAANVVISLGMVAQGHDDFWDFAWLLVGGYLSVEQVIRLWKLAQGHPAGSVLGALVRPLARRLLVPAAPAP
ncbi:MAG TPA: hypothetical protein VK780_02915 [Thermoanaerobaculia bacterium]|nr:hypothetical protein [Thermoanaerobaculia bacterium]